MSLINAGRVDRWTYVVAGVVACDCQWKFRICRAESHSAAGTCPVSLQEQSAACSWGAVLLLCVECDSLIEPSVCLISLSLRVMSGKRVRAGAIHV
jgi:hypothetical protein